MIKDETAEGVFDGRAYPDRHIAWELYERGRSFNEQLGLYEAVKTNENFFIGRQWEGVRSNGLPTPVFNILKRDVCFVVSTITTDNLKVQATPLAATADTGKLAEPARILSEELDAIFTRNDITGLTRELARDAAVRGDGCLYSWWDWEEGRIRTEVVENTRVYFGNPNNRREQEQPYIIIESHDSARLVRSEARENGCGGWESIVPDGETAGDMDRLKRTEDKVTKLLVMWREPSTGEIWGYKCTKDCDVKAPWPMGIRRYPIVWLNWDYVADSYHGQAMLTGLIPNQIFINKLWAMTMLSLMTSAYPKVVYDRTRIPRWSNQIGQAIGVSGGDMASVARTIDPAHISPQVTQFIELAVDQTNRNLGATSVALGDTRPDNTSAIIALQRAAATPNEITKRNLARCIEDQARIYMEFIAGFYGVRRVDMEPTEKLREAYLFSGLKVPEEVPAPFDFSVFRDLPMAMKLEAGASSYYSEIASIQTLDNLLRAGKIDTVQYLERIPDGYIPDRRGLVSELRAMAHGEKGEGG